MKESMDTQNGAILAWLSDGNTINPAEAEERFACRRLASRISDIKEYLAIVKPSWHIEKSMVNGVNRFGDKCHYAEYRLEKG